MLMEWMVHFFENSLVEVKMNLIQGYFILSYHNTYLLVISILNYVFILAFIHAGSGLGSL